MKRKANRVPNKNFKPEKRRAKLVIFDLYIQKSETFYLMKQNNKYIYYKKNHLFDIIKMKNLYFREKKTNCYDINNMKTSSEINIEFKVDNKLDKAKKPPSPLDINKKGISDNLEKESNIVIKDSEPEIKLEKENENEEIECKKGKNKNTDKNKRKQREKEINKSTSKINNNNKSNPSKEKKIICNVNSDLKDLVNNNQNINANQIKIIKVLGDGNCFYRCLSYFFLQSPDYYNEFKQLIIEWIDNNYEQYVNFFGDDEKHNLSKEEIAEKEFKDIKSKDSWGSDYTISIICLLLNIEIAVYINDGSDVFKPYHYFKIYNNNQNELMILSFHNSNHFDLIYSIHENIENHILYEKLNDININPIIDKNKIKVSGTEFKNIYVETKNRASLYFYDEIANYLLSIQNHKEEIQALCIQNPNWHYNQILSLIPLKYPKRLEGNDTSVNEKRYTFRKNCLNYKLDKFNRLCILNPLNKENEKEKYYKIPFIHEKNIIITENHANYNHCGKSNTYDNIIKNNWYWYGITRDIQDLINICPICSHPNKYKKLKGKPKIIIENGPHYRYVADLWTIPKVIAEKVKCNYILDIVDHFSKWYYGYTLITKEAQEVFNKIEIFFENFGYPSILQVDNGGEFDNNILNNYCAEKNIKIIHSSPYHPQTNGVVEVTHKEIQKYICNEYFIKKANFDIEKALFDIIKIHNNKKHSTTKRIPKEIKDLEDIEEINIIKNEIIKTLSKKGKDYDIIEYDKFYVFDDTDIKLQKNKIVKIPKKKINLKKVIKFQFQL